MLAYFIYGANGYTGALIAREAAARGQRPTLAGRNAEEIRGVAHALQLDHRIFDLSSPATLDAHLSGVRAVLNCAGPFSRTALPLAEACMRLGIQYLDITGEIDVFESLAARDRNARDAGTMLLPGVGFDVVPSDCLALHVQRRLPTADHLALGFQGLTRLSRGTAATVLENLHEPGRVRRDGNIVPVPAAWKMRHIDFGRGAVTATTIPWGDVSTAYCSTGIPNIEVYMAAPRSLIWLMRATRPVRAMFRPSIVRRSLRAMITGRRPGPSPAERARSESLLWAEARNPDGRTAVSRLRGPNGYDLTVYAALAAVERVLTTDTPTGFQTPATAFGPDFVLELPGIVRHDDAYKATGMTVSTRR